MEYQDYLKIYIIKQVYTIFILKNKLFSKNKKLKLDVGNISRQKQ